ncbi:MAG TPA: heavy metal-binding domain-containing protein [Verrucomicrobiae bacterium]|nr:heavy metal-binding domain-containing protein [Verrucomicrobiae bacterium]
MNYFGGFAAHKRQKQKRKKKYMKVKMILFVVIVLAIGAGIFWIATYHPPASGMEKSGRKILYYTCAMHPWVRESKPGQCPVCGMNLTPVYANEGDTNETANTNANFGEIVLEPESVSTINVQTDSVERRPLRRTIHISGEIIGNSWQAAWFQFTAYQRDLEWLKVGQTFQVAVEGAPDKTFTAQIKLRGVKSFADADFDMMTSSTIMRAEIYNPPVEVGNFGKIKLFNGLHAEAHLVAETEPTLTIPRSAVISRGTGAIVYVDKGNGHYAPRTIQLGRVGDEFAEVLANLKEGEKVVTAGNVLIDSEAQLTAGE